MKVIIIGTAHPYRGGLASFNERMARELQKEGHEVCIYTFTVQYPAFLFPGKTQYSEEPAPGDISILRKINAVNPLNWWRMGRKLKKEAPDLILIKYWLPFMGACFGTVLRRAKKNGKSKVIAVLDNIIPHEKRIGDRSLTRYFVTPVDAFVAMSKSVQQDLGQFDQEKPRAFNPHPIFDNFGEAVSRKQAADFLDLDAGDRYILSFGLVRDYKGLDWLLKAFHHCKYHKELKLIIAGEYYADKAIYDRLIEKLGLEEQVINHDHFIKDSEVKYYFSLANLVAQPYKSATQSGVTQIAYHFNCPMLVTNVGGLPEMIPDHKVGLVVPPRVEAIAEAIDEYFYEDLETRLREHFAEEKTKYSWGRLNETIYSLYNQIKS